MSERRRFFGRAIFVAALGIAVGWQLERAWIRDSPAYKLVESIHPLFDIGVGSPVELFPSAALGLWFGLVIAMSFDWRKHYHGILLLVGSFIAVITVTYFGNLLANIDVTAHSNQFAFIIGLLVAIAIEIQTIGEALSKFTSSDSGGGLEGTNLYDDEDDSDDITVQANRAIIGVALFSGVVTVAGLANLIAMGAVTIVDPVIDVGYAYAMVLFLSYNLRSDTQVVGPPGSGKTYQLIGLHEKFSERTRIALDESEGLKKAIQEVANKEEGSGFELDGTEGYDRFSFHYDAGSLFPVRVKFDTYDHRGEYLKDRLTPAAKTSMGILEKLNYLKLSIRKQLSDRSITRSLSASQELNKMTYDILNAEQLVVTIDLGRVINNQEGPNIEDLREVASRVQKNGGDVILVATKADLWIEEFLKGNVNNVNNRNIPTLPEISQGEYGQILTDEDVNRKVLAESEEYAAFADELTKWLKAQYKRQLKDLLNMSSHPVVFPVFYRTYRATGEDESEDPKPLLDEGNNLQSVGFEYLADVLEVDR